MRGMGREREEAQRKIKDSGLSGLSNYLIVSFSEMFKIGSDG